MSVLSKSNLYWLPYLLLLNCLFFYTHGFCQVENEDSVAGGTIIPADDDSRETKDTIQNFDLFTPGDTQQVQQRKIDDSVLNKLRTDEDFWYVNEKPEEEKTLPPKKPFLIELGKQEWFHTVLWVLIVSCFVAVIIWFLSVSNVQLFSKKAARVKEEDIKEETEDIFTIDYESRLQKAIAGKDYRLAVRFMYLQTLKSLAEKKLIQYRQERTNSDYVQQLYKTSYYNPFFNLTRSFEYSWYGQFSISENAFGIIKNNFFTFKQMLQK